VPEQEESLVLKTAPSGESFLKLYLLTIQNGVFLCLKRIPKKALHSSIPDIFDQALITLETSQQGTMRFVKEYQITQRREQIGHNYRSLSSASFFSQLLVSNAAHLPESKTLFNLTARSFDAFAAGKVPEIVLLKSLYLVLTNEGFPVRESWWPTVPSNLTSIAKRQLQASAPMQIDADEKKHCQGICDHLIDWMRLHTDLIVPD
jgi:recombinational DNA repair protein (RecF pathway)